MHEKTDLNDMMNWDAYVPDERYALVQEAIARARLERVRAVRAGLLWLVAAVRRTIARLVARPKAADTVTAKPLKA